MNTTTIFFYFFFACLGVVIGALIQRAQNRRAAPPPPATPPSPKELTSEDDAQVFSVWRTRDNRIWVEMDGSRLEDKGALRAEQRQCLIDTIVSLRPWLETTRPPSPAAAPVSATPQQAIQLPTAITPGMTPARVVERAKPTPAFKSIVEQIDDILQGKLLASSFQDREISLVEGPDGMVIVKDGKNRYAGVDAVPDLEIKALIQQAVAEWEKIS